MNNWKRDLAVLGVGLMLGAAGVHVNVGNRLVRIEAAIERTLDKHVNDSTIHHAHTTAIE